MKKHTKMLLTITMLLTFTLLPLTHAKPIADADGPYVADEGDTVTFDGSNSIDSDNSSLLYRWDLDNDGLFETDWSSDPNATYVWNDDWNGVAILEVSNGSVIDNSTASVTISNVPPTVDAGPDVTTNEGETVLFSGSLTDPGTNDTHIIEWNFGDGGTDIGTLTPTHTYTVVGVYTVTLNVTDDDGGVGSDTLTVNVTNLAPIVDAGFNQTVDEGETVSFNGNFSDPGFLFNPESYDVSWSFGDGGTATGSLTPDHMYADDGIYNATLTVTDEHGEVANDTLIITVNNVPPAASIDSVNAPLPLLPGDTVTFSGSAVDPGIFDILTFEWDFGDGDTDVGMSVDHAYITAGTYTVTLNVTDDDGGSGTVAYQLRVLAEPVADANGPYEANEGTELIFDAGASNDPNGDPLEYRWDFESDGVWDAEWSTSPTAAHTWYDDWSGTVTVEVKNTENITDTAEASVTITNVAPTAIIDSVTAPTPLMPGDIVSFSGSVDDPGTLDTFTFIWDFGDNNTATGSNVQHTYTGAGTYTVTLNVTDDDGGFDTETYQILITAPANVDIDPDTLNLNSNGRWITCYIEVPEEYDTSLIEVTSILLDDAIPAEPWPTNVEDYDEDGVPELMVKFDRETVQNHIINTLETTNGEVTLTVTGDVAGQAFEGSDTIRVHSKGGNNPSNSKGKP